jgi:hypothetical protein
MTLRAAYIYSTPQEAVMTIQRVPRFARSIPLTELQRIKHWHYGHKAAHPLECATWDAVMTVWVMGWVGWLPAFAADQWWTMPLCAVAMAAPGMYIGWRARAHAEGRLRCDWLRPPA